MTGLLPLYLPLAQMALSAPLLIALGALGGFLSGMFGVGGAFIVTPLLIFVGIPPAVAVGTQSAQLAGTGMAGSILKGRKRQLDIRMGLVMAAGSLGGVSIGAVLFQRLRHAGLIDLAIDLGYALILTLIGVLMLREVVASLLGGKAAARQGVALRPWGAGWPLAMEFPASGITVSVLSPLTIGFGCGLLTAIFGVGSGFVLVPSMLYLLRMPPALVAGTSMFQIVFTAAYATVIQSILNHNVDLVLALVLLLGSVAGVRLGARAAGHINPLHGRLILAALILAGAAKLWFNLMVTPHEFFTLTPGALS